MKKILLSALCIFTALASYSQTSVEELRADRNKLGGLYYAYPGPQSVQTPAPKGYKPFYISHFGRHGSRWLIAPETFDKCFAVLGEAKEQGVLTELGQSVYDRVKATREDHLYRHGDLSPLGYCQHQEIADRMYKSFPEVFKGEKHIYAKSTRVSRVMTSMYAFCSTIKGHNPRLQLEVNASHRDRQQVDSITAECRQWRNGEEQLRLKEEFFDKHVDPSRLMHSLFDSESFISAIDSRFMFKALAEMATIQQNVGNIVDLYDIFTFDELFAGWQYANIDYYTAKGPWNGKAEITVPGAVPILKAIIEAADKAIEDGDIAANLRFSHDSYVVPLATTLQLDGARNGQAPLDEAWTVFANYKISPMAGNIQLIFFRSSHGPVLVKFLLNENEVGIPAKTDCYPYYKWDDVKAYYAKCYDL